MNPLPDPLVRLFHLARETGSASVDAPPFGLEARVLAAWRSSRGAGLWDGRVLARGLAVAGFLVLASCWPAYTQTVNADSENLQLADSSVSSDLAP